VADTLFDFAAERLSQHTRIERMAARGTLRLALKTVGLDPTSITAGQLRSVIERLLPNELLTRGVADPAGTCRALIQDIDNAPAALLASGQDVDDIFRRLGGDG
jgi:hypothetical protein